MKEVLEYINKLPHFLTLLIIFLFCFLASQQNQENKFIGKILINDAVKFDKFFYQNPLNLENLYMFISTLPQTVFGLIGLSIIIYISTFLLQKIFAIKIISKITLLTNELTIPIILFLAGCVIYIRSHWDSFYDTIIRNCVNSNNFVEGCAIFNPSIYDLIRIIAILIIAVFIKNPIKYLTAFEKSSFDKTWLIIISLFTIVCFLNISEYNDRYNKFDMHNNGGYIFTVNYENKSYIVTSVKSRTVIGEEFIEVKLPQNTKTLLNNNSNLNFPFEKTQYNGILTGKVKLFELNKDLDIDIRYTDGRTFDVNEFNKYKDCLNKEKYGEIKCIFVANSFSYSSNKFETIDDKRVEEIVERWKNSFIKNQ